MKKIKLESEDEGGSFLFGLVFSINIKIMKFPKVPSTAIREIALLKELRHPNIVNLKDILMQVWVLLYLEDKSLIILTLGGEAVPDFRVLDHGLEAVHGYPVRNQGSSNAATACQVMDIPAVPGMSRIL